ncbi:MAG: HAD hydrolase-like protein [Alphaproteobacteria bacterium]|nr:HAD hydrolase-like protein [Alphaproteobacteria bacterium]
MKAITPIVGISKIINAYQSVICGFDGVLTKGEGLFEEALDALSKTAALHKDVIVLSNCAMRTEEVAKLFLQEKFDLKNLKAIITAGEILHYKLKNTHTFGKTYYNLGDCSDKGVFSKTNYVRVDDLGTADFVFIGAVRADKKTLEDYIEELETAAARGLTLVCAGTDVSSHIKGDVCLSSGAVAEHYAAMGGKIITAGKPDQAVISYVNESFNLSGKKVLWIGDSLSADVKSADLLKTDCVFVSQGIHIHALGEGFIPDVQRVRLLAMNYEVYPNYVISKLRW